MSAPGIGAARHHIDERANLAIRTALFALAFIAARLLRLLDASKQIVDGMTGCQVVVQPDLLVSVAAR